MTTNGLILSRLLDGLCAAGLDSVNVSLDSLDPLRFESITRRQGCFAKDNHYTDMLH